MASERASFDLPARGDIRRILIIKWSAMGDVTIASAAIESVRRAFPAAEIDLNTQQPWDQLFQDDPRFARVFSVKLRKQGWRGVRRWLREVRRGRYDLIIDLQTNDRSRLLLGLLRLCGGGPRYLLGTSKLLPYNVTPSGPRPPAAIDHLHRALAAAGIPAAAVRPALHVPAQVRERATALQREMGLVAGEYAVFMPGSHAAGLLKRWGAQRYAALARLLQQAGIVKVALIGGPDDVEECERLAAAAPEAVVNLCGRTQLLDIVPLVADARLVVANDTGTAHLASATERPIVVICGPTNPARVKPAGDNVVALQADLPCINCYLKECSHHSCMPLITPEQVLERLRALAPQALP